MVLQLSRKFLPKLARNIRPSGVFSQAEPTGDSVQRGD
jgi:hypothetical protein